MSYFPEHDPSFTTPSLLNTSSILITNATLLTMEGTTINEGWIHIVDDKIAGLGDTTEWEWYKQQVSNVSNTRIIDAHHRLVSPGLIDPHTHIGIDEQGIGWEGADYNETSEAVTPHLRALDGINPYDDGFIDAARTGVTTVQVLPGSANVIGGLMCCLKVLPGSTVEQMLVLHPSGLKMALGENPKKYHGVASGRAPLTRMGIAGIIREQLVQAQHYLAERQSIETEQSIPTLPRNLRMEALALALEKKIPVRFHAHRADDIATALRLGDEFELDLTIEHTTDGIKIAKELATSGRYCSIGPTLSARSKVELRNLSWETYPALYQAGVPISITTDHPVLPIQYLPTSAKMAIQAGLPLDAAWEALTIQAARHLHLADSTGSLQVGKDADVVIWNTHPLTDSGEVAFTIAGGQITFEQSGSPV
ncbi:imidazolonepropionase-like amidohydrolase [Paenibacillus sp. SORGH_AS306]|uniref:amidohydrolase n=1 Tax=unclassified Paenibacillus TaxID=185978 RepID=UPI0027810095|nr:MULTISPECIES: amidohydrolase [unclassified Paenibacillus]MDQ1235214.1 imidazolonepropionase-like amidohydrolase [Paenibacillus sp. SORGH_AS_0306]MDR6112261.1 imidazolonepropionase-like amidohydrolase [Paenibacillus sp. SORGH_AS_0338]